MRIDVYIRSINWTTEAITDTLYGNLTEILAGTVTREQNGTFLLEMDVKANANNINLLRVGRCLKSQAQPSEDGTERWTFVIDTIEYSIDQRIHVTASHPSMRLKYVPVIPFRADTAHLTPTINTILSRTTANGGCCMIPHGLTIGVNYDNQDFPSSSPYRSGHVRPLTECIQGQAGSLADRMKRTMYVSVVSDDVIAVGPETYRYARISLTSQTLSRYDPSRALSNPIRYGVNMVKYHRELSMDTTPHGAAARWRKTEDSAGVYLGNIVWPDDTRSNLYMPRVDVKNFSDRFENQPTGAQLKAAVSGIGADIDEYIEVEAAYYEGYTDWATHDEVRLGDTIPVIYPLYGLDELMTVIRLVYDVVRDRYTTIGLGSIKRTLPATLADMARQTGVTY